MENANMRECPCHGCEERVLGCHGKCERYQKWHTNKIEIKQKWIRENSGAMMAEARMLNAVKDREAYNHRHRRR